MTNTKEAVPVRTQPKRQCNDILCALLFLACFAGTIALAAMYGKDVMDDVEIRIHENVTNATEIEQQIEKEYAKYKYMFNINAAIAGGAALLSIIWSLIMLCCGKLLIWMAIFVVVVGNIACGVFGTKVLHDRNTEYYWWPALVGFLVAFLVIIYTCCIRRRIEFASANLQVATSAVLKFPLTILIAFACVIAQIGWCLLCVVATYGALHHDNYDGLDKHYSSGKQAGIVIGMLLIFYWGAYIIQNIVTVTVSGTVASWWLKGNSPMATTSALCRALTLNFGSIALGSFFVALLELIKAVLTSMIQAAKNSGNVVAVCVLSCVQCLFNCFQKIMQYFNRFAYAYVGIYGFSFLKAGKHVFDLFESKGWSAITNDSLIETVLMLGSLVVGFACAAIGFSTVTYGRAEWFVGVEHPRQVLGATGLIMGFVICHVMMSVISGAVAAVFVLFAEEPAALQATHTEHHNLLDRTWRKIYPDAYTGKSQEMSQTSKQSAV